MKEMQSLFGVQNFGRISCKCLSHFRTLELLKNLSKEEAEVLQSFSLPSAGDKVLFYNQDNGVFLESEFGITFSDQITF
jgi:hypothetical protein